MGAEGGYRVFHYSIDWLVPLLAVGTMTFVALTWAIVAVRRRYRTRD